MTGFEPAASCSQSRRSTKLSHIRKYSDAERQRSHKENGAQGLYSRRQASALSGSKQNFVLQHPLNKLSHIRKNYFLSRVCQWGDAHSIADSFENVDSFFVKFRLWLKKCLRGRNHLSKGGDYLTIFLLSL